MFTNLKLWTSQCQKHSWRLCCSVNSLTSNCWDKSPHKTLSNIIHFCLKKLTTRNQVNPPRPWQHPSDVEIVALFLPSCDLGIVLSYMSSSSTWQALIINEIYLVMNQYIRLVTFRAHKVITRSFSKSFQTSKKFKLQISSFVFPCPLFESSWWTVWNPWLSSVTGKEQLVAF